MRPTILLLLFGAQAGATPFLVTTTRDSPDALPGDGVCADALAHCSLRAAVQEANAWPGADAIEVPAGSYLLEIAGALEDAAATGDLDVTGPLAIGGAGAAATIVDGNALDGVFEIHSSAGSASLRDLGVRGGLRETACSQDACLGAGGIVNRAGVELFLLDVDLRENRATGLHASAILNFGCLDARRVRIVANAGVRPGDALAAVASSPDLQAAPSCLRFDEAEFSGNVAMAGALHANQAQVELRRSLVAGNVAPQGAALAFNFGNEVLVENSTIAANQTRDGAILNDGWSSLRIRHATITGNTGSASGGIHDVHGGFGQVVLSNTLLAGNHASGAGNADCNGYLVSEGGVVVGTDVDAGASAGGLPCHVQAGPADQYAVALAFDALDEHGGFTRSILPVAPAIDAGFAGQCAAIDQRGWLRPAGAACDPGAIELGAIADALFADGFDAAADVSAASPAAATLARRGARPAR